MRATKYVVDPNWQILVKDLGVSQQDLLRRAALPLDLFKRTSATLTSAEYYRYWVALADLLGDPAFPIRVVQSLSIETFGASVFACFCSPDFNAAVERLAQYKPLIGPMRLEIEQETDQTRVTIDGLPHDIEPPASFLAAEPLFLTQMIRLATREPVAPVSVTMTVLPEERQKFEAFLGTKIRRGKVNSVAFAATDARRPFLTANERLWSVFEPDLKIRMADLGATSQFRDRVRACLMEMLASGGYATADVARRLGVSPRTLQRRLGDEGTTFKQELANLRIELAHHYLANPRYSGAEISFLLGYSDPNSFIRAFHEWTGQTPEIARAGIALH